MCKIQSEDLGKSVCSKGRSVLLAVGLIMGAVLIPCTSFADQNNNGNGCSLAGSYNYNVTIPGNPPTVVYGVNTFTKEGTLVSQSSNTPVIYTGLWTRTGPNQYKVILERPNDPSYRIKFIQNISTDDCINFSGSADIYLYFPVSNLDLSGPGLHVGTFTIQLRRMGENG